MPAPISVVIPTFDNAAHLAPCLSALAEALTEGLIREVILADGGSSDATAAIADAAGARLVTAARGAGSQLSAGLAAARGDWVLIQPPGSVLLPGWVAAVQDHIRRGPGQAGRFRQAPARAGLLPRLAAARSALRIWLGGSAGPGPALLVSRILLDRAGRSPDAAGLARALRGRIVPLAAAVRAGAE